jgi:hypothetical protein
MKALFLFISLLSFVLGYFFRSPEPLKLISFGFFMITLAGIRFFL